MGLVSHLDTGFLDGRLMESLTRCLQLVLNDDPSFHFVGSVLESLVQSLVDDAVFEVVGAVITD
jgi:hypothetical protein